MEHLWCMLMHLGTKLERMGSPGYVSGAFWSPSGPPGAVSGALVGLFGAPGGAFGQHLGSSGAAFSSRMRLRMRMHRFLQNRAGAVAAARFPRVSGVQNRHRRVQHRSQIGRKRNPRWFSLADASPKTPRERFGCTLGAPGATSWFHGGGSADVAAHYGVYVARSIP